MSDEFSVDTERLMSIVERMAQVDHRVEAMIAEADSHVAGLHATWEGAGACQVFCVNSLSDCLY